MKISDQLQRLSSTDRVRLLSRLEGMEMAMRIARNRATDLKDMAGDGPQDSEEAKIAQIRENEASNIAAIIRMVQVGIGNGTQTFGDLSRDEVEEIMRIY